MKYLFLLLVLLPACSSAPKINKWTTPVYRTFIAPDGLSSENYVRIQDAMVESNRFFVVDRKDGFNAIVNEQNLTRINSPSRFNDLEKYARLGQLYSVGSVVVAHAACHPQSSIFKGYTIHCRLNLALISTSTGEVVATAEDEQDDDQGSYMITYQGQYVNGNPSWVSAINKLNENIPNNLSQKLEYTKDMMEYREVSKEDSQREKENPVSTEGLGR